MLYIRSVIIFTPGSVVIFTTSLIFMLMKSLELFSGSENVSQVCVDHGFDTWTVDNNPKLHPSICCDILSFDYSLFPANFDFIWASPDCRLFSRAGKSSHWSKILLKYRQYCYTPLTPEAYNAIAMIKSTIGIIKHYKPALYIIENPVGRLRHIELIKNFCPFRYSVNYKDWGFDYSKETDLFTNAYLPFSQKKVIRPGKSVMDIHSRYLRSVVPKPLVSYILDYFFSNTH
jgi:hypothetical protein